MHAQISLPSFKVYTPKERYIQKELTNTVPILLVCMWRKDFPGILVRAFQIIVSQSKSFVDMFPFKT